MIQDMDVSTLAGLLDKKAVTLIDVREPHEYAAGHIDGSYSIPLSVFPSMFNRADFSSDKPIVLQCQAGVRSMKACQIIADDTDVYNLVGGLNAWVANGQPIKNS